jgi:hypothetical protein
MVFGVDGLIHGIVIVAASGGRQPALFLAFRGDFLLESSLPRGLRSYLSISITLLSGAPSVRRARPA